MNAAEVLDHKADLLIRLQNPQVRKAWTGQIEADMGIDQPLSWMGGNRADKSRQLIRSSAAASIDALTNAMREAECFFVSVDLVQLVVYAASQLDQTDKITKMLLPTRSGIVRFEGGIPYRDVRGQILRVSWMVWGPAMVVPRSRYDVGEPTEEIAIWFFNDQRDEPDMIAKQIEAEVGDVGFVVGRWGFIGTEVLYENERLGPAWLVPAEERVEYIRDAGGVPVEFTNIKRLAHSFWLLLGQTVTESRDAIIDRARRKRAGRAAIPPRVVIVRLRNVEHRRQEGESIVEWSHRWIVRGHPAWRVCGPHHPQAQEVEPGKFMCRVWIAPYPKGPKDKPLIITDKVYKLDR